MGIRQDRELGVHVWRLKTFAFFVAPPAPACRRAITCRRRHPAQRRVLDPVSATANFIAVVVVLGTADEVTDLAHKRRALDAIVDRAAESRSRSARPPNDKELGATRVFALAIEEASAKIRTGGPIDDEEDLVLPIWAGHVPLALRAGAPIPAEGLAHDLATPGLRHRR